MPERAPNTPLKQRLRDIIFEAETPLGKLFDVLLLWLIGLSVLAIMLETVAGIGDRYQTIFYIAEWTFTILFTIEYGLRLWISKNPSHYAKSFFGVVDLLSILPSYLLLFPGLGASTSLVVIRILRLLRMFRVLKMVHHIRGSRIILRGLLSSSAKITVFFFTLLVLAIITGTLMYLVEKDVPQSQFTNIPISIYYAIVSMTTVGYGDITAQTALGKFLTTILILGGYAIIAVPTGIVSSELTKAQREADETTDACPSCGVHGHLLDAKFCRKCGDSLDET